MQADKQCYVAKHKEFYTNQIQPDTSGRISWKAVNSLLSKPAVSTRSLFNSTAFSQKLQAFFVEKVEKISINIASLAQSLHLVRLPDVQRFRSGMSSFQPVGETYVAKLILTSSCKTSPADFIPTTLLIDCLEYLIGPITRLSNLSLSMGIFPDCLKPARVTPILKKDGLDVQNMTNYRPISNLNFIGKY